MTKYAYAQDGNIEIYSSLPESWKNVSGLHHLANDINALNELGWYQVIEDETAYDMYTQARGNANYSFQDNNVIETIEIIDLSPSDDSNDMIKNLVMMEMRSMRNMYLQQCDWTQLSDAVETMSEEGMQAWKTYRRLLRELPELYANINLTSISQIIWPSKPE
jgi:hypothetical protein